MNVRGGSSTGMGETLEMTLPQMEPPSQTFDALYRASVGDLFAYVRTLLRDDSAAEDVTALAFERAYRRHGGYDPARGTERAWLFGIARNAALDELQRRKRTTALAADPVDERSASDGEDHAEDHARRLTVRAALERLDARERELIALKFHAGLSHAELAAVLGVSESNAASRLHRAMTKLRSACDA